LAKQKGRFSYIYGSASDDDDAAGGSLATLDRPIPVYEEFRSATARSTSVSSQRMSDHYYASIDDLDEPRASQVTRGPCSGAGTRRNAVPANILEPERRCGKYRWPQVER